MTPRRRALSLAAVLVATFANYLTITVLTIALRPVADELGAGLDDAAWLTIAPALVSGLLTPAFGSLADRFGRRRIFRFGLVLFGLGTLGSAIAPSMAALVAARVLTGIGAAASMPSGVALASGLFPPEERTVPMGYWTAVTAFAPAIGVLLGGSVIELLSWRYLFFGQLPFVVGSFVATAFVPESRGTDEGRFDYLGATMLGGAFFLLTLAANRANRWGLVSPRLLLVSGVAALLFVAVAFVETRVTNPVVPLRTMRDPVVRLALLGRSLMYAVHMGSFLLLPIFLLDLGGRSPSEVALMLLPRPLAMGIAAPLSTRLSRRFGSARVMLFGVVTMLLGVASLVVVPADASTLVLLPSLLGMGLGLGLSQTVTASEIAERTAPEDLGAASAMLAIATALSGSLGSAALFALATRTDVSPTRAFHDAFLGCAGVCVLACLVALRHVQSRNHELAERLR